MNDKSPRQHSAKKSGKSIKEKRADKAGKATTKAESDVANLFPNKQGRSK